MRLTSALPLLTVCLLSGTGWYNSLWYVLWTAGYCAGDPCAYTLYITVFGLPAAESCLRSFIIMLTVNDRWYGKWVTPGWRPNRGHPRSLPSAPYMYFSSRWTHRPVKFAVVPGPGPRSSHVDVVQPNSSWCMRTSIYSYDASAYHTHAHILLKQTQVNNNNFFTQQIIRYDW